MPPRPKRATQDAIVAATQGLSRAGLSPGRSGNVSVRWRDGFLVTASGIRPEDMIPVEDVVFISGSGTWSAQAKAPSSEWRFHKAIYDSRPDVGSVVHCHSRFATALACARVPIPPFHYMVAKAGGADIPLADYATYGSPELAALAAAALKYRNACLLANHGQIAIGEMLEDACELAEEVEALAAQYLAARLAGEPVLLSKEEMAVVAAKLSTYGQGSAHAPKSRKGAKPS